jgi:hypothetical protein
MNDLPERSGGVDIKGKQVEIKGDVVGHDKIVSHFSSEINPKVATDLFLIIGEIKLKIESLETIDREVRNRLLTLLEDANKEVKEVQPEPESIIEDLTTVQKALAAIQGIGSTAISIFALIEKALHLLQ